ncbi:MAG TPA: metallophosphoesterase [Bacteroidota bacterium]
MLYVLWFIIAFSIVSAGYGYAGWRLITPAHFPAPWSWIAWILLSLFLVLPVLAMSVEFNRLDFPLKKELEWGAYISLGFFSMVITLLVMRDITWLIVIGSQKLIALVSGMNGGEPHTGNPADPHRRELLVQWMNLGLIAAAGGLTAYGLYEARRRPAIVEVTIPIKDLPGSLQGFRIVQVTDIHAGLTVTRPFVEMVVEIANAQMGDIVAFTGDLVDGKVDQLREHVAPMKNLQARYGRYFITGNHEYYSGALPWVEEAQRLGFDVLLNEHRVIHQGGGTIVLAGVTDSSAGGFIPGHRSDPHKAIAGAPPADVRILLAHQPKSLYESSKAGFDVQISGHTHGGQFFPWNLLATIGQPYIRGLHKFADTWIYVSKGTGYWGPPVRLAARSEITVLTLVRDPGTNAPL